MLFSYLGSLIISFHNLSTVGSDTQEVSQLREFGIEEQFIILTIPWNMWLQAHH